jgi:ribosome-associated protein
MVDDNDGLDPNLPPSKSAIKREMQALQDLGKELIDLPDSQLARMPLSEDMREAMTLYKRLTAHEARRRQLQYIGKHMPKEAVADIRAMLEQIENQNRAFRQHFHQLEILRDELVNGDDSAVTRLFDQHAELDRQQLRNLVRQAQREKIQNKAPTASRKLFRFLRENIPSPG